MEGPSPNTRISTSTIIRSIILTFCVIILLFAVFGIIEKFWFSNLSMKYVHIFHLIRGLTASMIAATLVGWLIVRASHPLLSKGDLYLGDNFYQQKRIKNFIRWFIYMRWMAVIIASLLIYFVVLTNHWLPVKVLWPLSITVFVLALLNISYSFLLRYANANRFVLHFQTYADLIILTLLLHFSGGIENPLTLLLLIHVIIAGIILSQRHLFAVTATAIVLLLVLATGEATELFNHYTLNIFPHFNQMGTHVHAAHQPIFVISYVGMLVTLLLLTAYFISTIMNRIRLDEQQLEDFASQSLEQRQLIERALETTGTGLCVYDKEEKPYWINQLWKSWFGQQSIKDLEVRNDAGELLKLHNTLRDRKKRVGELKLNQYDDVEKPKIYQITTAPLYDKEGKVDHAVSLAQDITDQKEAQVQMMRAGKLAAVGELAGIVAHEVNNPIAILSAKCRLLLSDHPTEMSAKVNSEIVKITEAADRVAKIAQGLLSYCRPSSANRSKVDLVHSLRNALSLIEQSANRCGVIIDNQLPTQLPRVKANADELQQVFMNIFLNALDAMPDGGKLTVTTSPTTDTEYQDAPYLNIKINDTGIGIPKNIQQKIYDPFFTTKKNGNGTGLGLSISNDIIQSHGGTLNISSEPHEGTLVKISLPILEDTKN